MAWSSAFRSRSRSLLFVGAALALAGCGGNVLTQPSGGGGSGGDGGDGPGGQTSTPSTGQGGAITTSTGAGGAGGAACEGLGEIACLGAYPSCVPVYDNQCCPSCEPQGGCADCLNYTYHHCATLENGCLPEVPVECGVVPGWACVGGAADCGSVVPWQTKIPCAQVPGCVPSYCPFDADCTTDPVCIPVHGEMCGPVFCESEPPPCPEGTVPGANGSCWSGGCIPEALCAP